MEKIPTSLSKQFFYYFDEMENLLSTIGVVCLCTKYMIHFGKKRGISFPLLEKISLPKPTLYLHLFDVYFALQSLCNLPAKIGIISAKFKDYSIHHKQRIDFPRNEHPWIGIKVWATYTCAATLLHTVASTFLIQKWTRPFFSKTMSPSLYFLGATASLLGYTIEMIEKNRARYDQIKDEIKQTDEKNAYEIPIDHLIDDEVESQWMPSDYRMKKTYRKSKESVNPILIHREKTKEKYRYDQILLFLILCLKGIEMVKQASKLKAFPSNHLFSSSAFKWITPAHEMVFVALHVWTVFKHIHCDRILRELEG